MKLVKQQMLNNRGEEVSVDESTIGDRGQFDLFYIRKFDQEKEHSVI